MGYDEIQCLTKGWYAVPKETRKQVSKLKKSPKTYWKTVEKLILKHNKIQWVCKNCGQYHQRKTPTGACKNCGGNLIYAIPVLKGYIGGLKNPKTCFRSIKDLATYLYLIDQGGAIKNLSEIRRKTGYRNENFANLQRAGVINKCQPNGQCVVHFDPEFVMEVLRVQKPTKRHEW